MMRAPAILRNEDGQAQILSAMAIGTILLSGALYALQHAQQTSAMQVKGANRGEMRIALDAAIRHATQIFRNDAGCDPVELSERLARLQPDGTIGPLIDLPTRPNRAVFPAASGSAYPATWRRRMNVVVNGKDYLVSFGAVYNVTRVDNQSFVVADAPSGPMDAMVEVWTSSIANVTVTDPAARLGVVKVRQRAVLLNNCTYPCSRVIDGVCMAKAAVTNDDGIVYHRVGPTNNWPDSDAAMRNPLRGCRGNRRVGDVNANDCGTGHADAIDTVDLVVLRNYLRTGMFSGSCDGVLTHSGGTCATGCVVSGSGSCGDLNDDQIVDEADLNILEKILRGYLNTAPDNP